MAKGGENGQNTQETEEKKLPDKETGEKNLNEITQFRNNIARQRKESLSGVMKDILKKRFSNETDKAEIERQIRSFVALEGFPEMPANESYEDTMAMFAWMKAHTNAIELLNNEEILKFLDNKEYYEAARKTKRFRDELEDWFGIYDEDIRGPITAAEEKAEEENDLKEIDDNEKLSAEQKEKRKQNLLEKNEKARAARAEKNEKRKAPYREALNNFKEYNKLGEFAEKLSAAGNSRDKEDYKALKKMLRLVSNGHSFSDMYPNNGEDLEKMSPAQKKALPYYQIKEQINKYLDHKAKDGVNTKDLKKLAAVEELNLFVSERIKELNPEPFKLGKKTYKQENFPATYQEEFQAEAEKGLCNTATDGAVYEEKAKSYNSSHKGKSYIDAEVLKNASNCLDRIMLKVQKNNLNKIPKDMEAKDREAFINKKILKDLTNLKGKLVEAPITTKKAPSQVKEEPKAGALIQ